MAWPVWSAAWMHTHGWQRGIRSVPNRQRHVKEGLFHPVSGNTRFAVQSRITRCMGLPQVGHEATKG